VDDEITEKKEFVSYKKVWGGGGFLPFGLREGERGKGFFPAGGWGPRKVLFM